MRGQRTITRIMMLPRSFPDTCGCPAFGLLIVAQGALLSRVGLRTGARGSIDTQEPRE